MEQQRFPLDLAEASKQLDEFAPEELLGVLEIRDVYSGTKWDDTCIAEIRFYP